MKTNLLSIDQMLRAGRKLNEIAAETGLTQPELSILAKVLEIKLRRGRPPKQEIAK